MSSEIKHNLVYTIFAIWLVYLTFFASVGKRFTYKDGVILYNVCKGQDIQELLQDAKDKPTDFINYLLRKENATD